MSFNHNSGSPRSMEALLRVMLDVSPLPHPHPNGSVQQFLDGQAAWLVPDETAMVDAIAAANNPLNLKKKTVGRYLLQAGICVVIGFWILFVAPSVEPHIPEWLNSLLFWALLGTIGAFFYFLVRTVITAASGPTWKLNPQLNKISSAVGGRWNEKLAVVFYTPEELNSHTLESINHMRYLFDSAASQGTALDPLRWQVLTAEAVEATGIYFATGDLAAARQVRDQLDSSLPYRPRW